MRLSNFEKTRQHMEPFRVTISRGAFFWALQISPLMEPTGGMRGIEAQIARPRSSLYSGEGSARSLAGAEGSGAYKSLLTGGGHFPLFIKVTFFGKIGIFGNMAEL